MLYTLSNLYPFHSVIMHFWDSFYCNRNFFRNKNQQRRDARRDHESFGKQPLGKPGDYTGY